MIMRMTWIFGFISAFTDELAVQIIFVILNSLQGLFLFISFVCNKAVLSEIKKKRKENSSVTIGGSRGHAGRMPPKGPNSFVLSYKIFKM